MCPPADPRLCPAGSSSREAPAACRALSPGAGPSEGTLNRSVLFSSLRPRPVPSAVPSRSLGEGARGLRGLFPASPPGAARWKVPEGRMPHLPAFPLPLSGVPRPLLPPVLCRGPRSQPGAPPPPRAAPPAGRSRRGRDPRGRSGAAFAAPSSLPARPLVGAAPFPLPSAFCFPQRGLAQPRSRLAAGNGPRFPRFPPALIPPSPERSRSVPRRSERRGEAAARRGPLEPGHMEAELTWRRRRQPQPRRRNCIVRAACTKPGAAATPLRDCFISPFSSP